MKEQIEGGGWRGAALERPAPRQPSFGAARGACRAPVVRGLLEREGEADQPGFAERRPRERHAERRLIRDEAGRKRKRERRGKEPPWNDHAGVSGARGWVGAEVRREEDRVELLPGAASLVGHEAGTLLRNHSRVEDVEPAGPGQLQVERAVRLVIQGVLAPRRRIESIGTYRDRLAVLQSDLGVRTRAVRGIGLVAAVEVDHIVKRS